MDLAICISLKNRSNLVVHQEDPVATYKHIADKIQLSPCDTYFPPTINNDGTVTLNLFPKMLTSLTNIKKSTDNWTIIVVDYESTDFNIDMICKGILADKIPYVLHVEKGSFSRGGGLSIAARIAKDRGHTSLFFCDADMYFSRSYIFERAAEALAKNKIYYPICFSFTQPDHQQGYWRDTGYGMVFIKTDEYFNSSGWKYNISWGQEDDNLFNNLCKSGTEIIRAMAIGYFHQWHPNSITFKTLEYPVKTYIGKAAII